jgi:ribonuclease HII
MIERINVSNAANRAAAQAVQRLRKEGEFVFEETDIYLDGGLYIGKKGRVPHAKTVVKADEKFVAVRIASILAKVSRDAFMVRLGKKYPNFDFEGNKGYATPNHREALKNIGPQDVHRLTFLTKYAKIQPIESI